MPEDYETLIDRALAHYMRDIRNVKLVPADPPDYLKVIPKNNLPDRRKSRVVDFNGIPHIVIASTKGEALAHYRIRKNGRIKRRSMADFHGGRRHKVPGWTLSFRASNWPFKKRPS